MGYVNERRTPKIRQDLVDDYVRNLREKLVVLERLELGPATLERVRNEAHLLHGSGGLFGYPEISRAAARVEEAEPPQLPEAMRELLAVLALVVARGDPDKAPFASADGQPKETLAGARSATAILVDDDAEAAALVASVLEAAGVAVRRFASGEEFLAADATADVVLVDVDLGGGIDGFEVLARLRASARHATVPVVMVTAAGGDSAVLRAFALGADDHVPKPFSPPALVGCVRRLVERGAGRS